MSLNSDLFAHRLADSDYGLSAYRLLEHTALGQVQVFDTAITKDLKLAEVYSFIDIVEFVGEGFTLMGFTAAQLVDKSVPLHHTFAMERVAAEWHKSTGILAFVRSVFERIQQHAKRQAIRNPNLPFLPPAQAGDVFGVPHLYSALQRRLNTMGKTKLGREQWYNTIQNFTQRGIREEEMHFALLDPVLNPDISWIEPEVDQFTALELAKLCQFKELQMSIVAVHQNAQSQLKFTNPPDRKLTQTKKQAKGQIDQAREIARFDPVLGYRIEKVTHQSLWGEDISWQAVSNKGDVLKNDLDLSASETVQDAANVAARHAEMYFPKKFALGKYGAWTWTGGANYREWLITLPHYPHSYLSGHYKIRNVLAHIRCDIREGENGERIFMLQELQSDWAQRARRASIRGRVRHADETPPPFVKEWQALVMKLVLLHAANEGLDAIAWTRGAHQTYRYKDLTKANLNELYDRTLPREVNRLLKPYGVSCEMMGAFVPTNYKIKQTERGYEVRTKDDVHLGTAARLEDTREFVPDAGHELAYQVHGVRLSKEVRSAILANGFTAWG
jgi:hypothetical protein